jgi:hypothetical protein
MACLEHAGLGKLIRAQGQSPDHVGVRAKIVKRPVSVAEDLQVQRRVAHNLAVGFDAGAWVGSFNQYIVGHRAMWSTLGTRWNRCGTPAKQDRRRQTHSPNPFRFHENIIAQSQGIHNQDLITTRWPSMAAKDRCVLAAVPQKSLACDDFGRY